MEATAATDAQPCVCPPTDTLAICRRHGLYPSAAAAVATVAAADDDEPVATYDELCKANTELRERVAQLEAVVASVQAAVSSAYQANALTGRDARPDDGEGGR